MDIDEEIINLWKALNTHGVKFIVVGGFAVNLYGISRITADLDIWLKDTLDNRKNLRKALVQAKMPDLEEVETSQLVPGWSSLTLPSGFALDIMTFIKGFPQERFDESYRLAVTAEVHGVAVKFFHINQLIESKRATARPRDVTDIEELEKKLRES